MIIKYTGVYYPPKAGASYPLDIVLEFVDDAHRKPWVCDRLSALYGIQQIVVQVLGRRTVLGGRVYGGLHPVG